MTKEINVVVADDEPLACKRLVKLLKERTDVEVVAVCENGMEAIQQINEKQPDLVFLDIKMPEISGFDVLQSIKEEVVPAIIFVTAFDNYAIKAFDVHAVDYLLKPFDKKRFEDALDRAKKSIFTNHQEAMRGKLNQFLETVNKDREPVTRILIKSSGKYFFIKADDIDWIESEGNYVRIHSGGKNYLLRDTMVNMENKLDSDTFFRIHRSFIVNIDRIKELEQWFHGDYQVTLYNGETLTMSRNYKDLIQRFN